MGNSSLSHTPRSKIRTTAEIPLKKGTVGSRKDQIFVCLICCFCKLSSVAIVRMQWKDIVKFHVIFLLEPNTISDIFEFAFVFLQSFKKIEILSQKKL